MKYGALNAIAEEYKQAFPEEADLTSRVFQSLGINLAGQHELFSLGQDEAMKKLDDLEITPKLQEGAPNFWPKFMQFATLPPEKRETMKPRNHHYETFSNAVSESGDDRLKRLWEGFEEAFMEATKIEPNDPKLKTIKISENTITRLEQKFEGKGKEFWNAFWTVANTKKLAKGTEQISSHSSSRLPRQHTPPQERTMVARVPKGSGRGAGVR